MGPERNTTKRGTIEYYRVRRRGTGGARSPERKSMKRGTIGYYRIYWRGTGKEKHEKRYDWILQSILERHGGARTGKT